MNELIDFWYAVQSQNKEGQRNLVPINDLEPQLSETIEILEEEAEE